MCRMSVSIKLHFCSLPLSELNVYVGLKNKNFNYRLARRAGNATSIINRLKINLLYEHRNNKPVVKLGGAQTFQSIISTILMKTSLIKSVISPHTPH